MCSTVHSVLYGESTVCTQMEHLPLVSNQWLWHSLLVYHCKKMTVLSFYITHQQVTMKHKQQGQVHISMDYVNIEKVGDIDIYSHQTMLSFRSFLCSLLDLVITSLVRVVVTYQLPTLTQTLVTPHLEVQDLSLHHLQKTKQDR